MSLITELKKLKLIKNRHVSDEEIHAVRDKVFNEYLERDKLV